MNSILDEFKKSIITFLDELIETFPHESDFIIARIFLKDRISPDKLMVGFIKDIVPYKEMILIRDEKFFLEGKVSFFQNVNTTKVNHFKQLWKSAQLDEDDKKIIWQWFDTFILLAETYQKYKLQEIKK